MRRARWMQTGAHDDIRIGIGTAYACTRWTPETPQHTALAASTHPLTLCSRSFVVVGRKGKPLSAAEADQKSLSADQKKKKKKRLGSAVTPDFYHFQQHEKKREQLVKLREQFEADKARIAKMKSDRKFRPY
jgi:hypothetical protein